MTIEWIVGRESALLHASLEGAQISDRGQRLPDAIGVDARQVARVHAGQCERLTTIRQTSNCSNSESFSAEGIGFYEVSKSLLAIRDQLCGPVTGSGDDLGWKR